MKRIISIFLFVVIASFSSFAQDLSNPQATVGTHLDNLQADNYHPEISALSIHPSVTDEEQRIELAIHLKQILDGKGIYIYTHQITKDANFTDTISNENIYILNPLEPRIYLEKIDNKWYYAKKTIEQTDKMFKEVFPFGMKTFSSLLPVKIRNKEFLGLYAWQWFSLFLLIVIGLMAYAITHRLVEYLLHYVIVHKKLLVLEKEDYLDKLAKSFSWIVLFFSFSKIIPSIQLPPLILQYIVKSINILLTFLFAILIIRLFNIAMSYLKRQVEKTESKLDDQLLPIVHKLFRIIIIIIAISIALQQLNVNLAAILAGLSIGGLALALASQDSVKNFIGTVTILLDHPFEIGDYILLGSIEGTVEEVGMRATRLRTPAQSVAYIPNGDLSNQIIDNFGLRIYRRWKWTMGVEYGTSPKVLEEFALRSKDIINQNSWVAADKTIVHLNGLGASSIDLLVMVYLDVPSYDDELASKHKILLQLIELAEEMNVSFAFPTQTLHLKQ